MPSDFYSSNTADGRDAGQRLILPGYAHLRHISSSASHETFVAQREGSKEMVHIRVYALDYLRKHPSLCTRLERWALVSRIACHPNIVGGMSSFISDSDLFVMEEHCVGGELFAALDAYYRTSTAALSGQGDLTTPGHTPSRCLSLSFVRHVMRDIMSGLQYLHTTCGVAHRNIKLESIFLVSGNHAKLGRLGTCAVISACEGNDSMLQLCCASKHYAAPELVLGQSYKGELVDVWAAGVVLFVLLTGLFPFTEENGDEALLLEHICAADEVLRIHPSLECVPDVLAVDLVRNMLRVNPDCRLTTGEVLQHPFLLTS